ncbi:trigger factor [Eikenella sp. S3360]|uniref:Trigger factor n=1 Tax=Eikenella glucosivorans TaxID=2766967 RepID=A0ABS0N8B9_9NEIS|nr:trigger factor [Eikenella glucosivorans]MBH5328545.1 trigger factor [Eikenella glucosivorans]
MSVTIEKLEGLERSLQLELPWAEIEAAVQKRLQATQKRARVDGFRPGKAPLRMIESMYGAGIREEVMNENLRRKFAETIDTEEIRFAGLLSFDAAEAQDDEKVFKVKARFEVFPEITVGSLADKEIEKVVCEVGEAEVEKTIDILRRQRTRFNRVEREAKDGDRVIIDFAGTIDGTPFEGGSSQNYPFILGQGQMLPEFEAGIRGMKEGETKDVTVNFPADYHGKEVAGKSAVFAITLRNVAEAVLPEVDEQFAKALGIQDGDVAKMREEVKKNIEREVTRRVEAQTKDNVMNALLEVTQFDLPKTLVREEVARLANNARQNLVSQGMKEEDLDLSDSLFTEQAERRTALGLILSDLVAEHSLQPTDEQIKAVVQTFSESYEDPQEVVDWYFADRSRLEGPISMAVEANVVKYALDQAKVNEKKLSFDEVMGQQ